MWRSLYAGGKSNTYDARLQRPWQRLWTGNPRHASLGPDGKNWCDLGLRRRVSEGDADLGEPTLEMCEVWVR